MTAENLYDHPSCRELPQSKPPAVEKKPRVAAVITGADVRAAVKEVNAVNHRRKKP